MKKPDRPTPTVANPQASVSWPVIPFYERPENERCKDCQFLVRLRNDETDIFGGYFCRRAPPAVTSFQLPSGQMAGIAQWYAPSSPDQWCFEWQKRNELNAHRMPELPSEAKPS